MMELSTGFWIVGGVAVVALLPFACYMVARAISMAHYRSRLEYDLRRKQLGVSNEV
jgi:hypothetical protein